MSGRRTMVEKKTTAGAKGRRIAARMLYEIQRVLEKDASIAGVDPLHVVTDPYSLFADYRYKGEPQDNIVLRYLQRAAAHGDECVAGLCSALSDHCGRTELGYSSEPAVYMGATGQAINEGAGPTREQVLREHELHERKANYPGTSLH